MKDYTSEMIRNVALLGHGGCGKTTFVEAALLATGVITRLGKVEDGSTVSDYDKMEIEKGYSINTTLVPVEYNNVKINFVDTPGFFDFRCRRIGRRTGRNRESMGCMQKDRISEIYYSQ